MASNGILRATHGPTKIVEAAEKGDIDEVRNIRNKFPDKVNITYGGATALHMAAKNGHTDVVRYLKQHGADVNYLDPQKNTPLHSAVNGNQVGIVKLLLEMKANMTLQNNEGKTPPQLSRVKKYEECLKAFQAKDRSIPDISEETKPKLLCAAQFPPKSDVSVKNGCIHGCQNEACMTFEPCRCKITCFMCSMKDEVCKKCKKRIEKITYSPQSKVMKEAINEINRWKRDNEKWRKERECSICAERNYDCVLLECYHVLCSECADRLLKASKPCPICRKPFKNFQKIFFA